MRHYNRAFFLIFIILVLCGCASAPVYRQGAFPSGGVYHIVGSGQNLYRISKAYGVDMQVIMRANNIKNPNQIGVGEKLFIPKVASPVCVVRRAFEKQEPVENIVGPKQYKVRWRTITVHHSGTKEGNAESFDRNHRRRHMGGLFYHFVIGNGTDSGDGEIEVGWRWARQIEVNRKGDIQICLVGNFSQQEISPAQYNSLLSLIRVLEQEYNIPTSRIRRHNGLAGCFTECPGRKFPYQRLLQDLRYD